MRSCLAVIVDNTDNIEESIQERLYKYNEYAKVEKAYICTKQELINRIEKNKDKFNKEFAEFTLDKQVELILAKGNLIEENEKIFQWYNPDSKFIKVVEGGVFANRLYNKCTKKYETIAKIGEIDFKKLMYDDKEIKFKRQYNLVVYKHKPKNYIEREFIDCCGQAVQQFKIYKSKDLFRKYNTTFVPFSLVDENGWHTMFEDPEKYYNYVQEYFKNNKEKTIILMEYTF